MPLIRFENPLTGKLVQRYKRFFADVEIVNGEIITAHCPNTGKILGLTDAGRPALLSYLPDTGRKLHFRLEALGENGQWIGINTQWPNRLVRSVIEQNLIPELHGYVSIRPEVAYGHNSRIDLLLSDQKNHADAYVEIKNVHFSRQLGLAEFPDCVTERGAKHLLELIEQVKLGFRAVVIFCVQRHDVDALSVAPDLDPNFARTFDIARQNGVEAYALCFEVTPKGIRFAKQLRI